MRQEVQQTQKICPYLKQHGQFFYYCGKDMKAKTDVGLNPNNPIYERHVDITILSMHCFDEYETCCYYRGDLKHSD